MEFLPCPQSQLWENMPSRPASVARYKIIRRKVNKRKKKLYKDITMTLPQNAARSWHADKPLLAPNLSAYWLFASLEYDFGIIRTCHPDNALTRHPFPAHPWPNGHVLWPGLWLLHASWHAVLASGWTSRRKLLGNPFRIWWICVSHRFPFSFHRFGLPLRISLDKCILFPDFAPFRCLHLVSGNM